MVMLLISCNSDGNEQFFIDTSITISVKDINGTDRLDPQNPNNLNESDIKLYYLKDGEAQEVFNGNLDHPKGFFIYEHQEEHRIAIFPNVDRSEEYPVTYIQWSEQDMDTIKCKIKRTSSSEVCTEVWFNNDLKWDSSQPVERYFEITK